jgi:hypothetical protein
VGTCTLTAHVAVGTDYAAADGSGQSFAVDTDSTSTGLTSNAAGQSYGHEGATAFTVTVQTGNGEVLPTTDSATVHVGTASCVATLTPGGNGGGGHCSVGNNALTAGSYTASVTYGGDADLSGSGPATTPFTVTPAVDGVTFGGDPANPTVTVSGSGFGANSSAIGPPTGASCSASGSDYGTKFNFADNTNVWGAGTGPGDCIGVVISSYSNNQIVFTFGNGYDLYGGPINDGDTYSMTVLGTTFNGSASLGTGYTCTVSSLSGTTSFPVMVSESPAPPSSIDVGGTFSTALAAQVTVPASVIDHFIGLGATSLTVSSQTTSEDGLTAVGGSASGAVSPNTESASAFNLPLSDTTLVANTPYTYDTTYNPVTWQTGPGTGNVSFVPGTISAEATFVVSGTPTTESISCTPPSGVAALGSTTVDPPPPSPVFQVPSLSPPLQNTVSGGASGGSVATMAKVSKASVNGLAGSAGNDGGWAVTIANTSLASVTGLSASVSVSDGGAPLTYDLAAMAASGTNCANAGSGQLTCSIGTLAAGATSTLDVLVETTDLANGTGITGSVSVNSSNAGSQQTTLGPIGVVVIESGNGTAAVAAAGIPLASTHRSLKLARATVSLTLPKAKIKVKKKVGGTGPSAGTITISPPPVAVTLESLAPSAEPALCPPTGSTKCEGSIIQVVGNFSLYTSKLNPIVTVVKFFYGAKVPAGTVYFLKPNGKTVDKLSVCTKTAAGYDTPCLFGAEQDLGTTGNKYAQDTVYFTGNDPAMGRR